MGHAEHKIHDQPQARPISLDEYWMPFTPNREFKSAPTLVVRGEGMLLPSFRALRYGAIWS